MAYNVIEDFRLGLDRRRKRVSAPVGSLWSITNAHITRGGEIERAKKFVSTYALPAGQTYGLAATADALYTFGSVASPTMPAGVTYQRLVHPDLSTALTAIRDVTLFDGLLYVVAEFADGNLFHYYDGELVLDWIAGRVETWMTDNNGIAAHFAQLFADMDDDETNYTFGVAGSVITITCQTLDRDFTVETTALDGGVIDDQTATVATTTAASPGVAQVSTVTIGGTFDPGDTFTITLTDDTDDTVESYGYDASPDPVADVLLTHKSKVHAAGGSLIHFSAVDSARRWNRDSTATIGEGFINASTQDEGAQEVTALAKYQGQLAVFGENAIQLWQVGADPANTVFLQSLANTGTNARRSVATFGSSDCFYLARSGVRSLRARESSDAAYVNDVGTAIDPYLRAWHDEVGDEIAYASVAAIEPLDGRYWLAMGGRIWVYSTFPGSKISAWSVYEPGFTISAFARVDNSIYARSGDTVYLYGGAAGDTYPSDGEQTVTIELPFISGQKPASEKGWPWLALALENEWEVFLMENPRDDTEQRSVGTYDGVTFALQMAGVAGRSTHIALKLVCTKGGAASIASLAAGFTDGTEGRA